MTILLFGAIIRIKGNYHMKVRIVLSGLGRLETFIIKEENSSFISPSVSRNIDTEKFFIEFREVIKNWPEEMENGSVQDGLNCVIMFKDNDEHVFMFNNKFPDNFEKLVNLLRSYENGSIN